MRILFLTPFLPSPPRTGGMMRVHGLMSSLARSHSVSLLSFADLHRDHSAELEAARDYCDQVEVVENDRLATDSRDKRIMQLKSLAKPHSFERYIHDRPEFQSALDRMVSQGDFDVVNVEFAQMGYFKLPEGPVRVLDEHNIEYDILRRTAGIQEDRVRSLYSQINYRKLRREERHAWRTFDGVAVTSERDQRILQTDVSDALTTVVPNGVDTGRFAPIPEKTEPHSLVFTGANYYPNIQGINFFIQDVMPRLREQYPDLKLYVVGEVPRESLVPHMGDDVIVTGYVDDIREYIARAGAVIVPLFVGGGTRLKVLEAMSMAKPIVSTSLGAEGIDLRDGEHIFLADDAEAFARQIRAVFDDPIRASITGQAGRRLAQQHYDWQISANRLSEFYQDLLERKRRMSDKKAHQAPRQAVGSGSSRPFQE